MVEIKPTKNISRASDRDPTANDLIRFITHATWLHLRRRSAIQPIPFRPRYVESIASSPSRDVSGHNLTVTIRIRWVSSEQLIAD